MNIFKSHFWYNKNQRNGIFFLVILIIALQSIYFFVDFSSTDTVHIHQSEIEKFQKQIDSLKAIQIAGKKPKMYPFNPNYITDYKGEKLGMSLLEIDRLLAFRKTGKFVNSANEFQRVTQVSDSLLHSISPYFKFPDWVVKRNQQKRENQIHNAENRVLFKSKEALSSTDLNQATVVDFQYVDGVNSALAERIVKYRSRLQGFVFESQLSEVFAIDEKVVKNILKTFQIDKLPVIQKKNINTIAFKDLLKNPYIDYSLCKQILNYRDEVAELQNISELQNINGFPVDKYDRIVLYLEAK